MTSALDSNLCQELAEVIETLTHTGEKKLDPELMKKVKKICKSDDRFVEQAYHLLMHQLDEKHSEVRFSAFSIIDELFRRSHCFRVLVCDRLQRLLEATGTGSGSEELPPPRVTAVALRRAALSAFCQWHKDFGHGYAPLRLAHAYLTRGKKVDLDNLEFENSIEQARSQEAARHQAALNAGKLSKALTEFNELKEEMQNTVTSMKNCIELLIPPLDNFFVPPDANPEADELENVSFVPPIEDPGPRRSQQEKEEEEEEESSGDEEEDDDDELPNFIREHGMMNSNFSVEVPLKPFRGVQKTADNAAVFENARDLVRVINLTYLPSLRKWLQVVSKCSGKADDVKTLVKMKEALEEVVAKALTLGVSSSSGKEGDSSSEDDDDDLEEVPSKEGYEECPPEDLLHPSPRHPNPSKFKGKAKATKEGWNIFSKENHEQDPTTLLSTLSSLESVGKRKPAGEIDSIPSTSTAAEFPTTSAAIPSTSKDSRFLDTQGSIVNNATESISCDDPESSSRKKRLLAVAPKLPFDVDLYHWEEQDLKAPTILMVKPDSARFWSATSTDEMEEVAAPEGTAALRTRVIEFSGQHQPVEWSCRTPLPSGALCPRRDRFKCPFHGPIVPRDASGKCSNPEDERRLREAEEKRQQECPDWQDPKLLKELEEATGIDLKMPEKGKRKRKKDKLKYPGLTDIKMKQNNSYTRLSKKIFKKTTMKRVAQALDKADHKKFRDKFGDQFHYMHDT